jgi:hypothetical protein
MAAADEICNEPHLVVLRTFFEEAVKLSRAGIFQLKKSASVIGMHHQEKEVSMVGWLDFCSAHQVRRRFKILEKDLKSVFDMCKPASAEHLSRDHFQQALIMLGSKVGLHARMEPPTEQQERASHAAAFNSLVGVIVMLKDEFDRPPDPWKALLSMIPKMKTLFQKVAKNTKDPIGSLGKSGSLVSCREFVCFYEEQRINQMFDAEVSNAKLMAIFRKSQITENSEKSQCDLKEFSYAILLLAIELGVLDASSLEFYADSQEGLHSIFDHCDEETGKVLNNFVHTLLGSLPKSDPNAVGASAAKKQRKRHISLHGESGLRGDVQATEHCVVRESVLNKDLDEPKDGPMSAKKIQDIVSKGYIYRKSKTQAYVADARGEHVRFGEAYAADSALIEDVDFNPILELLEDDCIEVNILATNRFSAHVHKFSHAPFSAGSPS